ncbi:MAG: hypothetical protein M1828_003173 [Chrysothrix sp. TS-e1954]|nr:MAG: hypothetical protein M1828_003173 [Chrysothrix sp. TS-e1954]
MLPSLPLIVPHDAYTLWRPSPNGSPPYSTNDAVSSSLSPQQQQQQRRAQNVSGANPRSFLSLLDADEEAMFQRKENIARFGATWIRPPGVAKTWQATFDELVERREQEAIAIRDQAREEQEQLAQEAAGSRSPHGIEGAMDIDGAGEDMEGMDRDLDDEVPEADYEDAELSDEGGDGVEGQDDLDADIPEAGSYQHTDTEVEDESTDEEQHSGQGPIVVQDFRQSIGPAHPSSSGSARHGLSSTMSSPSMPSRGPRRSQR